MRRPHLFLSLAAGLALAGGSALPVEDVPLEIETTPGAPASRIAWELAQSINATPSLADRAVFADVPWIPGDMKEVVQVTFGC